MKINLFIYQNDRLFKPDQMQPRNKLSDIRIKSYNFEPFCAIFEVLLHKSFCDCYGDGTWLPISEKNSPSLYFQMQLTKVIYLT